MNMKNDPTPNSPASDETGEPHASSAGCLFRLGWLVIGPLCMVGYLMHLGRHDPPLVSLVSLGFWALVAAIIVVRYVDLRQYDGATTDGTRATMKDFRAYVVRLLAAGGVAWVATALI